MNALAITFLALFGFRLLLTIGYLRLKAEGHATKEQEAVLQFFGGLAGLVAVALAIVVVA